MPGAQMAASRVIRRPLSSSVAQNLASSLRDRDDICSPSLTRRSCSIGSTSVDTYNGINKAFVVADEQHVCKSGNLTQEEIAQRCHIRVSVSTTSVI